MCTSACVACAYASVFVIWLPDASAYTWVVCACVCACMCVCVCVWLSDTTRWRDDTCVVYVLCASTLISDAVRICLAFHVYHQV
jgi:hypothetical protein